MAEGSNNTREISLGDDFGEVILKVNGTSVQVHADGTVDTYPNIATKKQPSDVEQVAASLPEKWRAAFCYFIETGEAEKPLLDFLDSDKAGQAAIGKIFNAQVAAVEGLPVALRACALEGLAAALRSSNSKTPSTPAHDTETTPERLIANVDAATERLREVNEQSSRSEPATKPQIGDRMRDGTVYAGISPDTGKPMYTTPRDAPLTYTFNQAARYAEQLNAEKFLDHDDWRVPTRGELNVLFNNRAAIGGFNLSGSARTGSYWSSSQGRTWGTEVDNGCGQRFGNGIQDDYGKDYRTSLRCVRG